MKENMGKADQLIRLSLAFTIAVLNFTDTFNSDISLILGAIGVGFC